MRRGVLAAAVLLAGCGGSSGPGATGLRVSAATSLKRAFTAYGGASFSFGGSDELAAQIRQGVKPDVFASANTKYPDELFTRGLVDRPQAFAANRLVLAVPAGAGKVRRLSDAGRPGITLAVGSSSVPVGAYTRKVIARLPAAERRAMLANIRSEEPDVGGVVAKLTQRAVDAGFVYVTDVRAAGGRLEAIDLPAALQPRVTYAVAVVRGTHRRAAAQAFVAGLLHGSGARDLRAAGFEPAP